MRRFCWVLGILLLSSTAWAEAPLEREQEEEESVEYPSFRVGIGVSLASRPLVLVGDEATAGSPATLGNVQIPVHIGEHLRLEAEFGMHTQTGSLLPIETLLGNFVEFGSVRTHTYRFLIGAAWATEVGKDTIAYVGPKIGLQTRSMEFDFSGTVTAEGEVPEVKIKAVDFWLGGVVGGEAFLTRNFSLGVEVGLFIPEPG